MKTFKTKNGTELPITNLKGKDYLMVAYRLVWFREERPDWSIQTSLIKLDNAYCVARAEIQDQDGRIKATAHKREDKESFSDFMEKAETGAIGRALALVGFGTQFTADELEEGNRLADAPLLPKVVSVPISSGNKAIDIRPGHLSPVDVHMEEADRLQDEMNRTFGSIGPETPNSDGCSICGEPLKRTKKNDAWYCGNYKDKSRGAHDFIPDEAS